MSLNRIIRRAAVLVALRACEVPSKVEDDTCHAKTALGRLAHLPDALDGFQAPHARPVAARMWHLAHPMRPHPASLEHTPDSPDRFLQAGVRTGCGESLWHTSPRLRPPLPSTRCDLIQAPFVRHHTLHVPPVTRRLCDEETGSCPPSAKRARYPFMLPRRPRGQSAPHCHR